MAIKRLRRSRSDDAPTTDPRIVVSGHIRSPGETDTLPINLQISNSTITLRTNGDDLGSWPTTSVTIKELDATTFDFVVEGERMILLPTDPSALRDHPLVESVQVEAAGRKKRKPKKARTQPKAEQKPRSPKKSRTGVWIRTLDSARRHDIFGLDRVPINEDARGQEHQHTWDHRVAAASGPGKRICTICGKVRVRT